MATPNTNHQASCCSEEGIACATEVAAGRLPWLGSLTAIPAAIVPVLPSFTCPLCLAAYAGVLSSLGLGFVLREDVQRPLMLVFLAFTVASVAWSTRRHRRSGPVAAVAVGSVAIIAGRLVWNVPPVVYAGIGLVVVGVLWNLLLSRYPRIWMKLT